MSIGDIASVVLAVSAIGSLLYISLQVSVTRQQTKGQFLLALDEQFEKSIPITMRLVAEEGFKPVGKDWPAVWKLMSVYERINIMVEDKILDIAIVNRLHGFQLLSLVANDAIYERLRSNGAEWVDFIDLCECLARYRARKGLVPGDEAFVGRVRQLDRKSRNTKDPWVF